MGGESIIIHQCNFVLSLVFVFTFIFLLYFALFFVSLSLTRYVISTYSFGYIVEVGSAGSEQDRNCASVGRSSISQHVVRERHLYCLTTN